MKEIEIWVVMLLYEKKFEIKESIFSNVGCGNWDFKFKKILIWFLYFKKIFSLSISLFKEFDEIFNFLSIGGALIELA